MSQADGLAGYGRQIDRLGLLDFAPRIKSRTVARFQARILDAFDRLTPCSIPARVFARVARQVVGAFLYSLKIEINNRCTMNCRICYVRKGDKELPLDTLRRLYRSIRSCGVRIEILGGEPLLHGDVVAIIHAAKREARSPFVTLYTSAVAATAALSSELKAAGLDGAIISLLSHRESVHDDCTRQPGSWGDAVQGLRRMSEAGIRVFTFTPIIRHNMADVADIYEFVKTRLRASPLFYQYIPRSSDDDLNIRPEEWRQVKRWVMNRETEHRDFVRGFDMLTGNSCSGGNFVMTVKANGSVQPCPFVDDVTLGSIYDEDIWTIYRKRFRNRLLREFKRLPCGCRGCSYQSVCGGGCRAAARWSGGYAERDPKCLGPFSGPITAGGVLDCIPTFF